MNIKIATYKDLKKIKTKGNAENFVVVNNFNSEIKTRYLLRDMMSFLNGKIIVRQSVAKKLDRVNKKLKNRNINYTLCVVYGYRLPEIQERYFAKEFMAIRKKNNRFNKGILEELTHKHIAVPEVSGHPTGGAVDLSIFDTKKDEFLDMGSKIADFSSSKLATFSSGLTIKQKKNRQLLHDIMVNGGFCPFYEEWWHFSYGDKEWAWFYEKKFAIYDQVIITNIKKNVS